MQTLSSGKQMTIIRLYLKGYSYQEIANKAQVSKGTVANAIAALKSGQFPEAQSAAEELELLRELACDLHQLKLTPAEATAGLSLLSLLNQMGIEPTEIQAWASLSKHLASNEADVPNFVKAALYFDELRKSSGLSPQDLENKTKSLQQEIEGRKHLAQELKTSQKQVTKYKKQEKALKNEVAKLINQRNALAEEVAAKESRETILLSSVQALEERAHEADQRLVTARKSLELLASLGMSPDSLTGFAQRVALVAHRHGIEPQELLERLLRELEHLDQGLTLESLVQKRQDELHQTEDAIASANSEIYALKDVIQQLVQERDSLRAVIREEKEHVHDEMTALVSIAQDAQHSLTTELATGMKQAATDMEVISDKAVELGMDIGHFISVLSENKWLQTLTALHRGDHTVSMGDFRVVALTVLRSLKDWLNSKQTQPTSTYLLVSNMNNAIQEVEKWKV